MNPLAPLPWHREGLFARWQRLRRAGRLGHALLLSGPEGVGKRALARAMVAAALCEAEADAACGHCPACQKLLAGVHPDLRWLERSVDDKTGKMARDIRIEAVRELIEWLSLAAHGRRSRFVVIDPAEALNTAGHNALLKTLEEPRPGNHLLLISEQPLALPATLRSRCQIWACAIPEREASRAWCERQGIDERTLTLAGGAPLLAQRWQEAQQPAVFQRWEEGWKAVAQRRMEPLDFAAEIGKDDALTFIHWLQRWLHRVQREALVTPSPWPPACLMRVQREALEAPALLARNVTAQLVIESITLAWWSDTRALAAALSSRPRTG